MRRQAVNDRFHSVYYDRIVDLGPLQIHHLKRSYPNLAINAQWDRVDSNAGAHADRDVPADQQQRQHDNDQCADLAPASRRPPPAGELLVKLLVQYTDGGPPKRLGKLAIFAKDGERSILSAAEHHAPAIAADLNLALPVGDLESFPVGHVRNNSALREFDLSAGAPAFDRIAKNAALESSLHDDWGSSAPLFNLPQPMQMVVLNGWRTG